MQGFNKYYPPDYFDGAQKGLNAYHGKHALGDRARKLDKGILIVRFELPFNIWCGGCKAHIGQGVRYNAEKKKVDQYYSTPIYAFRCKCHLCDNHFEIRTDPQNTRYVVTEGAKQQAQDWDAEENGTIVLNKTDEAEKNAFERVEKGESQKKAALTTATKLHALAELNDQQWSDPFTQSQRLRKKFRTEKKDRLERASHATALRDKYGLGDHVNVAELETPVDPDARRQEQDDLARMLALKKQLPSSSSSSTTTTTKRTTDVRSRARPRTAKEELARQLRNKAKRDPFALSSTPAVSSARHALVRRKG